MAAIDMDGISYISSGSIEGYAYVVDEKSISNLKGIAFGIGISVDRIEKNVYGDRTLKKLADDLIRMNKKGHVLLCIDRPHLGIAPLLDYVSGVVLGEASMLCHLSVMLREKKKPAIIIGDKLAKIKTGDYIDFTKA